MDATTADILTQLRSELVPLYGQRLVRLVLFGSRARGDSMPDSDIDVLVVLKGPVDAGEEIRRTSRIISALSLEHNVVISRLFIAQDVYQHRNGPLLRNVRREGVMV